MEAHALRTFLNSRTKLIQPAGEDFEVDDDYGKQLEQRGIIKAGHGAPPVTEPTRTQALKGAPSTLKTAPITSGQFATADTRVVSPAAAQASGAKAITTPAGKR